MGKENANIVGAGRIFYARILYMMEQADPQQDLHGTPTPGSSPSSAGLDAPLSLPPSLPSPPELSPSYLLITLRNILRLNQTLMGIKTGYSVAQISRFENGLSPISPELIKAITPLYGLARARINEDLRVLNVLEEEYGHAGPPAE